MAKLDYLHQEINKFCPINGLSEFGDQPTIIHFSDEATTEQRAAAEKFVKDFVWTPELEVAQIKAARDEKYKDDLSIKAGFAQYKALKPDTTLTQYLDYLETL